MTISLFDLLKALAAFLLFVAIVQMINVVNVGHHDSIKKAEHCFRPNLRRSEYILDYRNACTYPITVYFCLTPDKDDLPSCYTNYVEYNRFIIPYRVSQEVKKNRRIRIPLRDKIIDLSACKGRMTPKRISGAEFICEPSLTE